MSAGQTSYSAWSLCLSALTAVTVSKQAIFERMNSAWVETLKSLLKDVIGEQAKCRIKHSLMNSFNNVWLQDSTCIKLPPVLFDKFRGNIIKGTKNAVAKLNVIVNLLDGSCAALQWSAFTKTEQALSTDIFSVARKGDLVIRDLGYFTFDSFEKMNMDGIWFLSRWRYGILLFNAKNGNPVDLINLLGNKAFVDIEILCGEKRVPMRLVAIKCDDAQAAERIRKAKANRHRAANHSPDYYTLLGYVIFLTNVKTETWNYKQIAAAYRLRWNIEILFKSWKSYLNFERMIPEARTNVYRVESWLYLLMLYVCWFQQIVYTPLMLRRIKVSIMKVTRWALLNTWKWITHLKPCNWIAEITYLCSYDTRRRSNAFARLDSLFNLLA